MDYRLRLVLIVFVINCGTIWQYYNISVVNNPQVLVEDWMNRSLVENYPNSAIHVSTLWIITNIVFFIGAVPGAAVVGLVADNVGRRWGLMGCGILVTIGGLLLGISKAVGRFELLIVGRFLLGYSCGLSSGLASMFVTEIPPGYLRGACGSSMGGVLSFGQLISIVLTIPELLGTAKLWPLAFGAPLVTGLAMVVMMFFIPESPRYLFLNKEDLVLAEKSLIFYQGSINAAKTLADLDAEKRKEMESVQIKTSLRDIFLKKYYRRNLIVALVAISGMQLTGIIPVMMNSTDIFVQISLTLRESQYASVGIAALVTICQLGMMWPVERFGRRVLILSGLYGVVTSLTAMLLLIVIQQYRGKSHWMSIGSAVCLFIYIIFFSMQAPIPFFLGAELSDQHTRGYFTTLVFILNWVWGTVIVLVYFSFKLAVGVGWSFLPFIIGSLLCAAYLHKFMPETADRLSKSRLKTDLHESIKFDSVEVESI